MPDVVTQDPLRLETCPACGYALEGLAPEGICPECGEPYDQSEIVLHGYGAGGRADVATARPWVAVGLAAVYLAILLWWVRQVVRHGPDDAGDVFWPAAIALYLAWSVWKRFASDMPGLVQVRLSPRGAVQVNTPTAGRASAGTPTPWHDIAEARIRSLGDDNVRIRLAKQRTFWRGTEVVVEADVRCAGPRAQALVDRVAAWQALARGPGREAKSAGRT
jgi:hypothetical protein